MQHFNFIFVFLVGSFLLLTGCETKRLPARQATVAGTNNSQDPETPEHESFTIESKAVNETRVICVWTPPSYDGSDKSDPLPVLYMPDGGINEDFPHIATTIAKLVSQGDIAPLILVGIENTERRRDLTGPSSVESDAEIAPITDGSKNFRQFIREELFPEIEKRYRVTKDRAIVGESAAGLFVVESFFREPEMFDTYIAMDPSIYWNDHHLVKIAPERLKSLPEKKVKLWFTAADTADIYPHTEALAKILKADSPANLTWTYDPKPDEKHHTIFRATKESAFKWALWKKQ